MNKIMQQFSKQKKTRIKKSPNSHKESCISCSSVGRLLDMSKKRKYYKEYNKIYKEKHKNEARTQGREWRIKNKIHLNEYNKKYRKLNQDKVKKWETKSKIKVMGISLSVNDYINLVKKQRNRCAICGREEKIKHYNGTLRCLSLDHNHHTKKVRGLLCGNCNLGLGKFQDNIELLEKAIKYLKKYEK